MDRSPKSSNKYDYNNLPAVKRALKNYLRLESKAQSDGNYDALATLMDLRVSIGIDKRGTEPIITERQKECVTKCLVEDKTEITAAKELGISQQAVFYNIQAGLKRIQKYLLTGETIVKVFSKEEELELIKLHGSGKKPMEIANILGKGVKTIRNKIKYLRRRGKLEA